jgi:hypothetical protein
MDLREKALMLGAEDLRPGWRAGKKLAVLYGGHWIHFGARGYEDYTTHHDERRRAAYRRRHAGILLADGRPAYTVKTSPAFWAWNLLW